MENCNYGTLHDELIRDRLVVGLKDRALSEKTQLDKDLTLEKTVNMVQQSEVIKKQQTDLRSNIKHSDIDTVKQGSQQKCLNQNPKASLNIPLQCSSLSLTHPDVNSVRGVVNSLAMGSGSTLLETWHVTRGKKGHYGKVRKSGKTVSTIEAGQDDDSSAYFLGSVDSGEDPWFTELSIGNHKVPSKIDTGADVTVISEQMYKDMAGGHSTSPTDHCLAQEAVRFRCLVDIKRLWEKEKAPFKKMYM